MVAKYTIIYDLMSFYECFYGSFRPVVNKSLIEGQVSEYEDVIHILISWLINF